MSAITVSVGGRNVTVGEFSGRKGARLLRLLEHVGKEFPDIQREMQRYTHEYEATHTIDIDRALARVEFPPQAMMREEPVMEDGVAVCDDAGRPLIRREPVTDTDGKPIPGIDPLGHLSEEDWKASGNKLRRPRSPSDIEVFMAIFPQVLDVAEDEDAKLLGLVAMADEEGARRGKDRSLWDEVAAQGDALLDAPIHELAELLIAAVEVVGYQLRTKVRDRLGERLTNAAESIGLG